MKPIVEAANALERAQFERKQIPPLQASYALDAPTAYAVQTYNVERRCARGQRVTGMKVGLTSEAMQRMLGVNEPDYGHLFDTMRVSNEGVVNVDSLLQPRVEAEIGIVLGQPLRGPNVSDDDVAAATAYVCAAIEIIDSRITDWKITLADTIADNGSSAGYVLGSPHMRPGELDLPALQMNIEKNGNIVGSGVGAAVLGAGPYRAVAWLANTLHAYGMSLEADYVVLPGALSAAISVADGDTIVADFGELGRATVEFRANEGMSLSG